MEANPEQFEGRKKILLKAVADSLLKEIAKDGTVSSIKEAAFDAHLEETGEIVQVQIVVTRSEDDKLVDFQREFTRIKK